MATYYPRNQTLLQCVLITFYTLFGKSMFAKLLNALCKNACISSPPYQFTISDCFINDLKQLQAKSAQTKQAVLNCRYFLNNKRINDKNGESNQIILNIGIH